MHNQGKLDRADIIVGKIMKEGNQEDRYGYFKSLSDICLKNKWKLIVKNNHSKIILFDTESGKFVLETSSNLNENPNIEQFSFEKSEELYNFYSTIFDELLKE